MYFFEDTCMPTSEAEIEYCESELECAVLCHNALNAYALYEQQMYLEAKSDDDDVEENAKSEGAFQKLKNAILTILEKINNIIKGFLDSFSVFSKNRLTADKYMDSDTAKIRLSTDIVAMKKNVDRSYLEMRPVISKISSITGKDLEVVAKKCDAATMFLENNRAKLRKGAVKLVQISVIEKVSNDTVNKMQDVQKLRAKTEESAKRMNRGGIFGSAKLDALFSSSKLLSTIANQYQFIGKSALSVLKTVNKK